MTIAPHRPTARVLARSRRSRRIRQFAVIGFSVLCAAADAISATPARSELTVPPQSHSFSGSYLAARSAGRNRDLRSAAEYYRQALRREPNDLLLRRQTFTLSLADGDVTGALPFAKHLVEGGERSHFIVAALGADAIRTGEFDAALDIMRDPREDPLATLTLGILRGWAHAGAGDTDRALTEVERLRGPDWYEPFKNYHAGLIAAHAGRLNLAEEELRIAHQTENGSLWVRVAAAYARVLEMRGKREAALSVIDEAIVSFGSNALIDDLRMRIVAGEGIDGPTPTVIAGAAETFYSIGIAVSRDGGEELTLVYLRLALHLREDMHLARLFLANYFERSESHARMIEVLDGIPPDTPLFPEATIRIGVALNSLDRFAESQAHLQGAIDTLDDKRSAISALGNVLRLRQDYEGAAEVYTRGIEALDPPSVDDWRLFYFRGITYERTDQWPKAEADFRRALDLRPEQPQVLNYLGYSWVDKGMNYAEALEMIKRAVELRPNDGYIVDSLGWAYYKLGRFEEAVVELERAVELRPTDATINDHLGDAYWRVGRELEAMFQWSHARDGDPEPELLAIIESKLASGLDSSATDRVEAD